MEVTLKLRICYIVQKGVVNGNSIPRRDEQKQVFKVYAHRYMPGEAGWDAIWSGTHPYMRL